MKFSIVNLMTCVAAVSWFCAFFQLSIEFRPVFLGVSVLGILGVLLLLAMTLPKGEKGTLDYERNSVVETLEPGIKLSGWILIMSLAGLVLYVVVFSLF